VLTKKQPLSAKIGEVKFRQKVIEQLKGKKVYFPHYLKSTEISDYLKKKSANSWLVFQKLKKEKIPLSPFLDIGAGQCARTALLTSRLNCRGFSLDISAESLQTAPIFCQKLELAKLPLRICADATRLPFADNSFPFVFTFETLHHFPDPEPVVKEAYRVLAPGGFFYIGEEPVKRLVHFSLWRRDGYHLRWWEKILKALVILHFISAPGKSEVAAGILEETFSLPTWEKALDIFEEIKVEVIPFPFGPKSTITKRAGKNWLKPKLLTKLLVNFAGGGLNILGRKKGKINQGQKELTSLPVCPDCQRQLAKKDEFFICPVNHRYPIKNGIWYLLPERLMKKLYPNFK